MKIKLEFMLPDVEAAELAGDQMLLARVEDKYIHILAKPGTDLGDFRNKISILKRTLSNHIQIKG